MSSAPRRRAIGSPISECSELASRELALVRPAAGEAHRAAASRHSEGGREFINNIRELGLTEALSIRDASFRDGRTIISHPSN